MFFYNFAPSKHLTLLKNTHIYDKLFNIEEIFP